MKVRRKMLNNSFILNSGFKPIIISFIIALLSYMLISETLGNIVLIITLVIAYIFRNPERDIMRNDSEILSITDGRIDTIDIHNNSTNIYINVSILDTHVLRAPFDSNMEVVNHRHGINLNPNSFKATLFNETLDLKFDDLTVNLLSGVCNTPLDLHSQANISKGDNIGTFINGIIKVTFTDNEKIKLNIDIGDKVKAGQTIIAFKK